MVVQVRHSTDNLYVCVYIRKFTHKESLFTYDALLLGVYLVFDIYITWMLWMSRIYQQASLHEAGLHMSGKLRVGIFFVYCNWVI